MDAGNRQNNYVCGKNAEYTTQVNGCLGFYPQVERRTQK